MRCDNMEEMFNINHPFIVILNYKESILFHGRIIDI